MRYPVYSLLIVIVATLLSCSRFDYKKSPGGLVYKIFSDGKGRQIKAGEFVKFHFENKVNDSVYRSSFGKEPIYTQAPLTGERYDISELWTRLRIGDSIIVSQPLDSFIKKGLSLPPEIKKGDRLHMTIKIIDIFPTDSAFQADQKKTAAARLEKEKQELRTYFEKNKISGLEETASGAFVKITEPGTGSLIDSGKYVGVKYKGSLFTGKVFDTNIDSSFGHTDPLTFTVDVSPMIKGFTEAVKKMRQGGSARVFIPATLGYGTNGSPPNIGPNENLIFDITVTDVKDKAPEPPRPAQVPSNITDSIRKKREQPH
jgi:FKBP-type peptidyl-prolyl cis-trans isomerase